MINFLFPTGIAFFFARLYYFFSDNFNDSRDKILMGIGVVLIAIWSLFR